MAPDFEYIVRMEPWARVGHTWPGILTFTLPLAFLVLVVWRALVRDAMRDLAGLAPLGARERARERGARWWLAATSALALGIASHVVWDGFTHWDGYAARWFPVLAQPVVPSVLRFFWANALQHTSTAVGGAVVLAWFYRQLQTSANRNPLKTSWRLHVLSMLAATGLLVALWNGPRTGTMTDPSAFKLAAGRFVVGGMAGLALGIAGYALWWRMRRPTARAT